MRSLFMTYELEKVKPTGTHTALGCFPGRPGSENLHCKPVSVDSFPPTAEGKRLRSVRRELAITLGETARILGIGVVDVSSLERGRCVFKNPADWESAFAQLRSAAMSTMGIR
jgi:hypothetical protein